MSRLRFLAPLLLLAVVGAPLLPRADAARPAIRVRPDPMVELCAIVFRLAGNPEYSTPADGSTARTAIDAHFGPFRDHAAVRLARTLRSERGISYDAVVSLATHIHNPRNFALAAPLDPWPEHLDRRWDPDSVTRFVAALRSFVADTGYLAWWDTQRETHEALVAPLRENLLAEIDLPWFRDRLGLEIEGTLEVIVSPAAGASAYSSLARNEPIGSDPETTTHVILGAMGNTLTGNARRIAVDTIVHELCHPTVNPATDAALAAFEPAREVLYPPIALAMEEQGYADWKIVMREVFVRLYTRSWVTVHRGASAGKAFGEDQTLRGFALVDILAEKLAGALHGKKVPSVPKLVEMGAPIVLAHAEHIRTTIDPHRPRILAVEPAVTAEGLSAGPVTLRITFDRPMEPGYSFMKLRAPFPEVTAKPEWNDDRTVFSIPLRLAEDTRFELGVNGPGEGNFRGAKAVENGRGARVIPFRIVLSTVATATIDRTPPTIVSISPTPDAKDVAAGRTAIRIAFDRPMAASYSVTGGGVTFPKVVGEPRWNDDRTVFTLPVELVAGRSYTFGVNGPNHTGFQSAEGIPVEPRMVGFTVAE